MEAFDLLASIVTLTTGAGVVFRLVRSRPTAARLPPWLIAAVLMTVVVWVLLAFGLGASAVSITLTGGAVGSFRFFMARSVSVRIVVAVAIATALLTLSLVTFLIARAILETVLGAVFCSVFLGAFGEEAVQSCAEGVLSS